MNYLRKISTNLVGLLIFSIILLNGLPRVYAEEESPGSAEIRVESATPSESSGESGQQNSSTEPAKEKSQESDKKSETGEVSDNNTNPLKAGKEKSQTEKKDSTNGQENGEKPEKDSEKADLSEEIKPVPLGNPSQTPKAFTVKKRGAEGTEETIVGEFDKFYDAVGSMDNNGKDGFYTIYVNRDVTVPADERGGYYRTNNKFRITSGPNVSSVLKREGEWGILAIQENCELTIDNITLDGSGTCQCLFISNNGKVTIGNGATIQNFVDTDKESGPAIHVTGGTLNILPGATIQNNNSNTQGGAIQARNGTTVNISGGTFSNNKSNTSDGGFLAAYGELNITGGKFENNKAKNTGGAIIVGENSKASIENATFENNQASTGGAINSLNDLTIKNSTFTNNQAKWGGAIRSTKKLTLEEVNFKNNTANSAGGALYLQGGAEINNSDFEENKATINGGAIYSSKEIEVSSSKFSKNSAKNSGAIHLKEVTEVSKITDSLFTENNATEQGGAVWANNSDINIDKTNFNNNSSGNYGGALCFNGDKTFSITNSSVIKNKSDLGGGIFALGGNLKVENTTIESNNATNTGGGILSLKGTSLSLNKVSIKYNTSPSGAGVVVGAGNVGIKESEFNGNDTGDGDNQEQRLGGGFYIGENANVNISKNTKFIDNKAGMGGAIFTENLDYKDPADTNKYKNLTIEDTTLFKGNIARVGLFYPPNNFKEFNNLNFSSDSDVKQNVGNRPSLLNNNDINYKSNTSRVTFINDDKVYKVVFVQNGKSINSDDLIDESMPANPTKAGYTFENWNEKKDGKGENFNDATIVNGDRLVYAIYKKNPPKPSDDRPGPVPDYRPDEKPEIPDDIKEADPGLKQDDSPIEKEKEKPNEKEAENTPPVLEVKDGAIKVGEKFDPRTLITKAYDKEDGSNLVDSVIIDQGKFDNRVAGRYEIQYSLIDKSGSKVTKLAYLDVLAKANKENLRNSRENPKTGIEAGLGLYSTILLLSSSAYTAIRKKY